MCNVEIDVAGCHDCEVAIIATATSSTEVDAGVLSAAIEGGGGKYGQVHRGLLHTQ